MQYNAVVISADNWIAGSAATILTRSLELLTMLVERKEDEVAGRQNMKLGNATRRGR